MTVAEERIQKLSATSKQTLIALFGSLTAFYETFYLMMRNEHQLDLYREEGWAERLRSAQYYRRLATERVAQTCNVDADLLEDIYSDYFEDFAHYREREIQFTEAEFLAVLKKLIV